MSNKPTIVAREVSKTYSLTSSGSARGLSLPNRKTIIEALKPANFVAYQGESIGIIGKNGSGKSTLMRLLAGSESPTSGEVYASTAPTLLGVSAALQSSLSGRQNIQLGLLASGMHPEEAKRLEQSVIDWAELNDSIDRPLRTYSSGMSARLKFAISTASPAEILLIDEALSTGDATFKAKAHKRMESFLEGSGTVVLVSHGVKSIRENCERSIWLHEGEIIADGETGEVSRAYVKWTNRAVNDKPEEADAILREARESYARPEIVLQSEVSAF